MQFKWIAYYSDNTTLEQNEGKSLYPEIDRNKLSAFGIEMDGKLHYRLFLEEGQKLIYRHKGRIEVNTSTEEQKNLPGYFMIGYQENVNGKNRQCITYIDEETGLIQTAGKFVEGSEPNLREEEKING
mgnify:CR=1 FL=1